MLLFLLLLRYDHRRRHRRRHNHHGRKKAGLAYSSIGSSAIIHTIVNYTEISVHISSRFICAFGFMYK